MFIIKECQSLITHCEKMLKKGAKESEEHYLLTMKTANDQLQKILLNPPGSQTVDIKNELKKLDNNVRTIERTLAGQPIF